MAEIDFISCIHKKTQRDYIGRVNEGPKAKAAEMAKTFGAEYWDGDRKFGYGGFKYDGRWKSVAEKIIHHYKLKSGDRVLDVGCGKGFLLYELKNLLPGLEVAGVDISEYAVANAKPEIKANIQVANANKLPFKNKKFDLVISITTLHNLYCYDFDKAIREINRVSKKHQYVAVESYRNEEEKVNLLYWQLTCEMFCTPGEWKWWFDKVNYKGDYSFIYFE